ncbi:hypothetical protein [Bradyrhizobium sp. USDA 10063]
MAEVRLTGTNRIPSVVAFCLIGLLIYVGVYAGAEYLVYRNGRSNPFFKIATADNAEFDWVILGPSHAMPLDFADFNHRMERETGLRIINLATQGTGPLYHRFVLEAFLRNHRARYLLYIVDSFAFSSQTWNEDRFSDAKLLRTTPLDAGTVELIWRYWQRDGVDGRAVADYLTGFSKINNRDRFKRDLWEGEFQFDRVYRGSESAIKSRIAYLFPDSDRSRPLSRYMMQFDELLAMAEQRGLRVTPIKMPIPGAFRAALPDEVSFDQALLRTLGRRGLILKDFSGELQQPKFYFDSDHLNRSGVSEFFEHQLKQILAPP